MQIVPDVVLCQTPTKIEEAKAGTASRSVLAGIMVRMRAPLCVFPSPEHQQGGHQLQRVFAAIPHYYMPHVHLID